MPAHMTIEDQGQSKFRRTSEAKKSILPKFASQQERSASNHRHSIAVDPNDLILSKNHSAAASGPVGGLLRMKTGLVTNAKKKVEMELGKMTNSEKAEALSKLYRDDNQQEKINRKDPDFKLIYKEIAHYDEHDKLRIENIKISRKQIVQYLRKRYSKEMVEKIVKAFNFAPMSSMDDYCKTIDAFTSKSIEEKRKLGFAIHDTNNDGKICPGDVFSVYAGNSEF